MKTTVIFLTLLALSSVISAQNAFSQVKNLINNLTKDIVDEQKNADVRNEKDTKKCSKDIQEAIDKVNSRQKDVEDLEKHIKWLEHEKSENEKDLATRKERVAANEKMLAEFKKQRCDNNLLFVKQLREHMEAVDLLEMLKKDVNEYFAQKKAGKVNASFIERFAEFSHLLADNDKQVLVQITQAVNTLPDVNKLNENVQASTSTKARTAEEVGTGHVDNAQDALKALDHVEWKSTDVYFDELHKKLIVMIDGLVAHLKNSRDELIKNEIKAAEDFAVFQSNVEKENEYLRTKILEIENTIKDLENQINIANGQLAKRKVLHQEAIVELENIERICKEKEEYYKNETARRNGEIKTIGEAQRLFDNILNNLSQRVKERADNINSGQAAGNALPASVVANQSTIEKDLAARQGERAQVVF